ncbi:MAG: DNA polymerase III subunit alpha [Acidobacteria bacterium]|nr:DNA polymerase III subunit alpha [Acidobacteriota bacterium]
MAEPFVHLHCHTDYSMLDGACEIGELMQMTAEMGMPAVAMTDHGNLFGAVEFYNKAKEHGVRPVIGCELYVAQQGHTIKTENNRYNHLVALCETQEGYQNLNRLVSTGYLNGFYHRPRVDKDLLAQHSKGLIVFSACLRGDINEALLAHRYEDARRLAYEYQDIFGKGNFFLEIQDHGLEQDREVLPALHRLSAETGIPLIATNDSHYLKKDDARPHEILLCIGTGKTMSDASRLRFTQPVFYIKSRDEMMQLFGEVEHALTRTWEIAQRCDVRLEKVKEPFPRFDVPGGHSTDTYFAWVARHGFEARRGALERRAAQGLLRYPMEHYVERLENEIAMIQKMKFSGYFLIVWDFIRHAKSQGIPVGPGRGSAAGSLVGYAMGITDVDPLQYDLLFERFLNPERISMPDIDIDFCTNRRGEVIQYVTEKYGRDYVAQIITFGTLGARQAIKDVGRALDMPFGEVEKITKLIPAQPLNIGIKEALEAEPELPALARKDPKVDDVLTVARRLEGLCRNAGVHAAGVVISSTPLKELVPLYRTVKDEVVTQFDMVGLEKLNLLKMDFLGLTTLTIVTEAVRLIEQHRGVKLVIEELPLDDAKTYGIFSKGYTSGVFQFESPGMKDILRRYVPDRLTDLIALNALYRPGPMKMIDDYIDRKHGRKKPAYDLPQLEPILEETFGVIVYQEQVMQISNIVAGYSLGEADILRRAMGKKKKEEMDAQRVRFLSGASAKGINGRKAEKIFDQMAEFAKYGFNKSHSAAYAYLAYITAYLKAHYPTEFMSALLTSETGNIQKVVKYINECRDMGIQVLPPDINHSEANFTPDGDAVRFGIGAVKIVGPNAVEKIVVARKEAGRFQSLVEFCEAVDLSSVNKRMIENLVKCGAMDSLGGTRSQLTAVIDKAVEAGQRALRDRMHGQAGLFADFGKADSEAIPMPNVPDWTAKEKLIGEKETIGFYVTGHPLDEFRDKIADMATHDSSRLEDLERNADVALCGLVSNIQRKRNKEGKLWASFQLQDHFGIAECMCFATAFEQIGHELVDDRPVLVRGLALPEENGPARISVKSVTPLEVAGIQLPRLVSIRVVLNGRAERDRAAELMELFGRKRGEAEVRLRLEKPRDFSVILDVAARVRPDKEFTAEVERICGPQSLEVLAE